MYLSQTENEVFKYPKEQLGYSNLSKLEWEAIRSLAGDRRIVIKKTDKGSCVAVLDRLDYLMEAENNLRKGKCIKRSGVVKMFLLTLSRNQYHI